MERVCVTLDEEVVKALKLISAELDVSVSACVNKILLEVLLKDAESLENRLSLIKSVKEKLKNKRREIVIF